MATALVRARGDRCPPLIGANPPLRADPALESPRHEERAIKPLSTIDRATTPEGTALELRERDGELFIYVAGELLMSSRTSGSEKALAEVACAALRDAPAPRVLIGGLGMGFTTRAALDILPSTAAVTVAEVFARVIEWNRGPLRHLAGDPLADPRVTIENCDVSQLLGGAFEAILLDVDNGPDALTLDSNQRLYSAAGLRRIRSALTPSGLLAVWSASSNDPFATRMRRAGFATRIVSVRARGNRRGHRHTIFVGTNA